MKRQNKQFGMTLIETTVTVAVVSLLAVLSTPSIRAYFNALGSPAEVKGAISAAFASARAIAAKEQHYAGVRFQQDSSGKQYMIFIIQDPAIGATFFRTVEGQKPVKLPDNIGVMDFTVVTGRSAQYPDSPAKQERLDDSTLSDNYKDGLINNVGLTDVTTFSIIFSPAGKLVIHGVCVRNRNGEQDTPANAANTSDDDVFNKKGDVDNGIGMFYQDDYWGNGTNPDLGLGPEPSRSNFVIYDKTEFGKVNINSRWTDYLSRLASEVVYINPYTGTIIQGN
jgi:prepilin-type N-terminal cleavage/methylation domain-containing protein